MPTMRVAAVSGGDGFVAEEEASEEDTIKQKFQTGRDDSDDRNGAAGFPVSILC